MLSVVLWHSVATYVDVYSDVGNRCVFGFGWWSFVVAYKCIDFCVRYSCRTKSGVLQYQVRGCVADYSKV
jgi:hypothetical protein